MTRMRAVSFGSEEEGEAEGGEGGEREAESVGDDHEEERSSQSEADSEAGDSDKMEEVDEAGASAFEPRDGPTEHTLRLLQIAQVCLDVGSVD